MTDGNSAYDKLAERMGAPGSVRFARILEAMMTPDEADILVDVSSPMTLAEIAEKTNIDEKSLKAKLDDMEERQVIRKMGDRYYSPNNIVMFHHGAIGWMREDLKKKVYPLWGDFFFEEWADIIWDGFMQRKASGAPGAHRIIPSHKALKASPKVKPEDILWYEDMEQILRKSERISFMMCGCRGLWRKSDCDRPIETCMQVLFPPEDGEYKGEAVQYIKPPKDYNFEEALAVIDDCEDRGMIHIPLNTSHGDLICNCCDDCCMVIHPLLKHGNIHEILTPSRYRAVVDQELCSSCQTCVKRCKFDAIEMVDVAGSDKPKASIINEHCLGCGVCVVKCPKQALTMELIRPPEHIPTLSVMELMMGGQKSPTG